MFFGKQSTLPKHQHRRQSNENNNNDVEHRECYKSCNKMKTNK
jgi:hypothetical protein